MASNLTSQQLATLKAAILAETDPTFVGYRTNGQNGLMAGWLSGIASPAFKVWRTDVSRSDIYNRVSDEGTTWSWTFYKSQSVTEQNAWTQMFMGDRADFSQANLRAGIAVIFTSASAVNGTHALAVGKRSANRAEKLFATGTGTVLSPATMTFEGSLTDLDVQEALAS